MGQWSAWFSPQPAACWLPLLCSSRAVASAWGGLTSDLGCGAQIPYPDDVPGLRERKDSVLARPPSPLCGDMHGCPVLAVLEVGLLGAQGHPPLLLRPLARAPIGQRVHSCQCPDLQVVPPTWHAGPAPHYSVGLCPRTHFPEPPCSLGPSDMR